MHFVEKGRDLIYMKSMYKEYLRFYFSIRIACALIPDQMGADEGYVEKESVSRADSLIKALGIK